MIIDNDGNYILNPKDKSNIDYLILQFTNFNSFLDDMLRREPDTREAIMESRYKDLLCLRIQLYETHKRVHMLIDQKTLQADSWETLEASSEHPFTYGND